MFLVNLHRVTHLHLNTCSLAYIFMIDKLHEFELSVRSLGVGNVLERPGKLLDGNILGRYRVVRGTETHT